MPPLPIVTAGSRKAQLLAALREDSCFVRAGGAALVSNTAFTAPPPPTVPLAFRVMAPEMSS